MTTTNGCERQKPRNFSSMNLKECKMYFLEEAYYKQRITNEKSAMSLVHGLNDMQNLNSKGVETCVKPGSQLLYGFMSLPLGSDSGGRRFLVAYKLEDLVPRKHLVHVGELKFLPFISCCRRCNNIVRWEWQCSEHCSNQKGAR